MDSLPPETVEYRINRINLKRLPVKPGVLVFWFKYCLTVYVYTATVVSSFDFILTSEEVENVAIISGLWMGGGKTTKTKEDKNPNETT